MPALYAADLHLGHNGIVKYRNFKTVEEHDDFICNSWCKKVRKKNQTVYVLGDVAFSKEAWLRFDDLPGTKVIVLGNHCTEHVNTRMIANLQTVTAVHGLLKQKEFYLSHAPLHPEHLRGKFNIHGHLHKILVRDPRYFNVSMENIGFMPITIEDVREELQRRRSMWHTYKTLGAKAAWIARKL